MKLYFAGPLFTRPERAWNAEVTAALRAGGHEVYLPQEEEPGRDGIAHGLAAESGLQAGVLSLPPGVGAPSVTGLP
ncbi:MAG: nucleoside 2-deoxyribosyltransferase domain-containing protein [Chloroflexota bacterium]|nr:nucleoside 2-deoxyribosyltransferase domain-containing protein [Chloroflexota bacterium]